MGDNDFPALMGNSGIGFLQSYLRGRQDYSQAGTDIPAMRLQNMYEQEQGGPLVNEQFISASPSFDLGYPKIPGRNLEGIPNANDPVMREKLRQRLLKNPMGGEELPGFLKKA
jgi:hypothetical protein